MTTEKKPISIITIILSTATIIGALEVIGGYLIYPKFEDTVIEIYEEQKKEEKDEDSSKAGFRELIGKKMAVPEDEVHIKVGNDHKTEDAFRNSTISDIKDINGKIEKLEKFDERVRTEVIHYHPGTHLQVMPN